MPKNQNNKDDKIIVTSLEELLRNSGAIEFIEPANSKRAGHPDI
jgi:hypothetical protein